MRFSNLLAPTLREIPKEAEVVSHQLMIRAGMIRKVASGIYSYLPLGFRIIKKFEEIIREEMNRAGAQEVFLPSIIPAELWRKSGRWDQYGKELLRLRDRKDQEFCYGPTHEEVITELAGAEIRSYKQLPVNLYQIQNKFRDEIRPRFGLMRGREFGMKDAYSFHGSWEDLDKTYQEMYKVYTKIFQRCGLNFKVVEADSGTIGGSESAEFMVTAKTGEDEILECSKCDYAANVEAAETVGEEEIPLSPPLKKEGSKSKQEVVETPGMMSIEEVSGFLKVKEDELVKSLLYKAGDELVLVLVRGDHELNEVKLKNVLGDCVLKKAGPKLIKEVSGAEVGFLGPIGLKKECKIYVDYSINENKEYIVGANQNDKHFKNVVLKREVQIESYIDLRNAHEGDKCARCNEGKYRLIRGIEVGHIFKLGDKYSKAMAVNYLDELGKVKPYIMGCYGIGIGRTVAAAIEQNHDEKGIIWPIALAPYHVDIILVSTKDPELKSRADEIYKLLQENGIEVIYDEREESPGVKFKDAELIGFPIQLVIGRSFKESGKVELKTRKDAKTILLEADKILPELQGLIKSGI